MTTRTTPLVSVGVTSYRRPLELENALDSVLGQTYRNLEVIVSDNCSRMDEVECVLERFSTQDIRVRLFRQDENIGMMPNHTFVLRKATGDYFLWLHIDDQIPQNYIEKCMDRFSDSEDIVLVGPKANAYMEGRYWYTYSTFSTLGQHAYHRFRRLIDIGYSQPSAFQQYFFGIFRRDTLAACVWEDGKYYWDGSFSLFFRISELGFLHLAEDVSLDKFNRKEDFKKWRDKNYCDKPIRFKFAGAKVSEVLPKTLDILVTLARSQQLTKPQKIRLMTLCIIRFISVLFTSKEALWKRVALIPYRLLRKALHITYYFLRKLR
ncbi:glycosyltransferase family 2 protein [Halieaceae bacterium IMCC14734]|uniref:Glycosyltransferase family 2 protein n=1 Tax=Candidatus Litorirhabdus singularis TaxID=2518993 RepID=A0ABT3TF56_9GAMM|nr:glycosyltransferase family 2 protein [Candidatus Litorirhabdus singularis]MCX2980947.1 glycosyltransferase family 2 protein [Candidatus Litorirhabdus singularis]